VVNANSLPWIGPFVARVAFRIRKLRLAISDPIIRFDWCGHRIRLPLSHELPRFTSIFPDYNRNLARITSAVTGELGRPLKAIDVGANVGDTALLMLAHGADFVLCIEGSSRYAKLLRDNVAGVRGVACEECLVAFAGARDGLMISESRGTGFVVEAVGAASSVPMSTLDSVVGRHADAMPEVDLVKIDTDGFDGGIIRQHAGFLQRFLPVMFFEFYFSPSPDVPDTLPCPDISALDVLEGIGYDGMIVFRNTGEAAHSGRLSLDREQVLSLGAKGAFGPYADIAVFHRTKESQFAACLSEFGCASPRVEPIARKPSDESSAASSARHS